MIPPITMYGATYCEDTAMVREHLNMLGIPFNEVNIDLSKEGENFVVFINNGRRLTPTLVIGEGLLKLVLSEPSNAQVEAVLQKGEELLADAG